MARSTRRRDVDAWRQIAGSGKLFWLAAAIRVLRRRQAMVIGPTPPGTGVMAPATCLASANATSPTSRDFDDRS